jgi:hypothetical protein
MKTVKALFDHLNSEKKFYDRYPNFDMNDKKIHILFLSPCMNESGYYRMILPALELNKTESHCAIIVHIHKWDFHKVFDDYDNPVDFHLVQWADYVVLPTMHTDVKYIIDSMRKINSDIDFVIDIDSNYHEVPDYHPQSKNLTKLAKHTLLNNLALVNLVTAPNSMIINYYNNLAQQSDQKFTFYSEYYPNLISNFAYEEAPEIFRNSGNKIRIGLILDASFPEDLATIESALKEILEKHTNAELVIYGWSDKIRVRSKLLQGVGVKYEPVVSTTAFPACLNKMTIDIGIIPYVDNVYNHCGRAFNRFLDFSGLMIPSVMPAIPPFKKIITDGENGFVASSSEEWFIKITKLIQDGQFRSNMGREAFRMVWQTYSYNNPKSLQKLKEIFS